MSDTTRLIIVAVGGQGNLLASSVLGEAALLSGVPFRMSEIHGMAQRGGVVESAMVFGKAESSIISDGEADLLVGFEPVETLRALNKCNPETVVITNLTPLPPFTVAIGKGVYPPIETILGLIRGKVRKLITLDATALAREAGNILAVNMVLLGALAQSGILPLNVETIRKAIGAKTKPAFLEANLKAFDLGVRAAA
ncbi:indolepyruvate oxidoreductase subunit beta [Desulfatirhabdium butyrativorans]|uniref:indolepyruvate oxidoreductase subunit beta n=1 Tax=Desulfatirhabdium butyrativorans TaxID=340467 RepID=UPI00054F0BAA|nr:indolepyruvate oxidoreductase subunit beta [Desulfatirhabdium butyrativorans]